MGLAVLGSLGSLVDLLGHVLLYFLQHRVLLEVLGDLGRLFRLVLRVDRLGLLDLGVPFHLDALKRFENKKIIKTFKVGYLEVLLVPSGRGRRVLLYHPGGLLDLSFLGFLSNLKGPSGLCHLLDLGHPKYKKKLTSLDFKKFILDVPIQKLLQDLEYSFDDTLIQVFEVIVEFLDTSFCSFRLLQDPFIALHVDVVIFSDFWNIHQAFRSYGVYWVHIFIVSFFFSSSRLFFRLFFLLQCHFYHLDLVHSMIF